MIQNTSNLESDFSNIGATDPYFGGSSNVQPGPVDAAIHVETSEFPTDTTRIDDSMTASSGQLTGQPTREPASELADVRGLDQPVVDIRSYQQDESDLPDTPPMPMPIRGGFAVYDTVQPELQRKLDVAELVTRAENDLATTPMNSLELAESLIQQTEDPAGLSPAAPSVQQNAEGHFVAQAGSTAIIDGDEGYDYIDLTRYDIGQATFDGKTILIDDPTGGFSFTIEHRNVPLAIFANGTQVELQV